MLDYMDRRDALIRCGKRGEFMKSKKYSNDFLGRNSMNTNV